MSIDSTGSVEAGVVAQEVATRVLVKQHDAASQQADALVGLIEAARQAESARQQAAAARGGIDTLA